MRVIHLLSSNKLSGAENVAAEIISTFSGYVEMAYMSPNGDINKSLRERNVTYIPIRDLSINEIKKGLRYYKPDIIHAHDIRATIQAVRCANKIPVISQIHGNHDDMKKFTMKSLLYLIYSIKVKHIIAVSNSVLNEYAFMRIINKKSSVIYNVIDSNRIFHKVREDNNNYDFDFVYVGRLAAPKNPERVAKVASRVLKKEPGLKFGIIGEGEYQSIMEKIFISEEVNHQVTFFGYLNNPYKVLSQAKSMLMCSHYEGTPIVALEALLLGVPIISTAVDGMRDLIISGQNGYISDDDSELVDYTYKVISSNNDSSELSKGAMKSVDRFTDLEGYKQNIMEIYRRIV